MTDSLRSEHNKMIDNKRTGTHNPSSVYYNALRWSKWVTCPKNGITYRMFPEFRFYDGLGFKEKEDIILSDMAKYKSLSLKTVKDTYIFTVVNAYLPLTAGLGFMFNAVPVEMRLFVAKSIWANPEQFTNHPCKMHPLMYDDKKNVIDYGTGKPDEKYMTVGQKSKLWFDAKAKELLKEETKKYFYAALGVLLINKVI